MSVNQYAWEKIRKLESELDANRRRHASGAASRVRFVGPEAVLSRLASALRRGGRTVAALDREPTAAPHPVIDVLLDGRGSR